MDDIIEESIFANCISGGTPIVAVQREGKLHNLSAAMKTAGAEQICSTDQIISGALSPDMISAALRNASAYRWMTMLNFGRLSWLRRKS